MKLQHLEILEGDSETFSGGTAESGDHYLLYCEKSA